MTTNTPTAQIFLHPDVQVGPVDRRLFGSFVEHLGRAVYTGIYEPGHPAADSEGRRRDVLDLIQDLGVTVVRYPGGNFVSNYVWEDGIGPREDRKPFIDKAWRTIEPNTFGTDDFLQWAEVAGVEPMMAVNLGTRGVEAAAALVEYCNAEAGSRWADLRIANGREKPYGVKLWCLGNEMDGPWQIGHKPAKEYARLAAEAGKAMRRIDPTIELVVCGSSAMTMPTFGTWEREVLEETFDLVDHISMHAYYEEVHGDRGSFLASGASMDKFIRRVVSTADAVAAQRKSDKKITISFDEWNVWYLQTRFGGEDNLPLQRDAPRIIEDIYSALDAVVVGDLLITLLNHADRVPVAALAQLVNVIAPIMTEPGGEAWRQPTFFPFATTARLARGTALDLRVTGQTYETAAHGEVEVVSAAATHDAASGELSLFLTNRGSQPATVQLTHPGLQLQLHDGQVITADQVRAVPGPQHAAQTIAEHVQAAEISQILVSAAPGKTELKLAPESWTALRATPAQS